jgi:hypothetical protein
MSFDYDAMRNGIRWAAIMVLLSYAIFIAVGNHGIFEFEDKISYGGASMRGKAMPALGTYSILNMEYTAFF